MLRRLLVPIVVAATCGLAVPVAHASPGQADVSYARRATAKFHDLGTAERAGYGLFTDASGVACIDMPGMGAMGIHYVKGTLVGDGAVDALTPEALVYAPGNGGQLHLAALEYVVFKQDWDALHSSPPSLFGHEFNVTSAPNRYELPDFYSLHVWIWKHNPAGMFASWNPDVSCP